MKNIEKTKLILKAPLSGSLMPIERVPDPVFSQKMVGDGISIDPLTQTLMAPCSGEVVQLHAASHAITILTPIGIEVMMHIGLDTVNLKGKGFTPKVKEGDNVKTGDFLIEFNADFVATHAKSLLTQIVITNSDRVTAFIPSKGIVKAGEENILELILDDSEADEQIVSGKSVTSDAILIPNPTGLHARPAAVLANLAKQFKADIALHRGEQKANAKSVVSIMGMDIVHGDKIVVAAKGDDSDQALETIVPELMKGLGDEGCKPAPAPATTVISKDATPPPKPRSDDPNLLLGVPASPGFATGNVLQIRHEEIQINEDAQNPNIERRRIDNAFEQAKIQLEALQAKLLGQSNPAKAAIFAAHQELLEDPDLLDITESAIAKGKNAEYAWKKAFETHADRLANLNNEILSARANDLRDVGQRVLRILTGIGDEELVIPENTILIAEDLTPSDTANLDSSKVLGFCTVAGGASSHVAIIARAMDIPAVAGIEPQALEIEDGSPVIIDGSKGRLRINPTEKERQRIVSLKQKIAEKRKKELESAMEPAITTDGHRVEVAANIGGLKEAEESVKVGGEGVGLLRSEFLFMDRLSPPDEKEQTEVYTEIIKTLGSERPLIIRTLDVGGDKPLSYLPIPKEDNPFLGERGIRIGLDRPEILRTQIRAILKAGEHGKMRLMFPMIATLPEIRMAKSILQEEQKKLNMNNVQLGIMVEVPSTAMMAEQFAKEVDFFSIGTNDLTQYTLAMDRGHPKLAPQIDPLNPAVLRLIARTVEGAHKNKKWVGICGGVAGDPQAVPILVGLGVDELSVSVPVIPSVKAQIREYSLDECTKLAQKALEMDMSAQVRTLVPLPFETFE